MGGGWAATSLPFPRPCLTARPWLLQLVICQPLYEALALRPLPLLFSLFSLPLGFSLALALAA